MKDLLVHPKTTKTNFSFISAKKHKKAHYEVSLNGSRGEGLPVTASKAVVVSVYQKSAKIDTISVENMRTGICLSSISLCVPSIRICHAQIGTIHPTQ